MGFACASAAGDYRQMAFSRDALLLIGHGSSHYEDAGHMLHVHAAALRAEGQFAQAAVGFLRGAPGVAEALAELTADIVHVVPFFMEDGYFSRVAVPAALRQAVRRGGPTLRYCRPVGLGGRLTALIGACVLRQNPAPGTLTVVLVGHGSGRAPGRSAALRQHCSSLAAAGSFSDVRTAFLEEPPFVADVLGRLRASDTAVLGFFAGDGGHVRDDLPRLIAAERAARGAGGRLLLDMGSIGDDPALRSVILDQVGGEVWFDLAGASAAG
jgi:sirohydrochlorin cobaltochelatase